MGPVGPPGLPPRPLPGRRQVFRRDHLVHRAGLVRHRENHRLESPPRCGSRKGFPPPFLAVFGCSVFFKVIVFVKFRFVLKLLGPMPVLRFTPAAVVCHRVAVLVEAGRNIVRPRGCCVDNSVHIDSQRAEVHACEEAMARILFSPAPLGSKVVVVRGKAECSVGVAIGMAQSVVSEPIRVHLFRSVCLKPIVKLLDRDNPVDSS